MDLFLYTVGLLAMAVLAPYLPPLLRRLGMLAGSLAFYATLDWHFPIVLLAIVTFTYGAGLWLDGGRRGAVASAASCVAVLGPLAVYKYVPIWLAGLTDLLPVSSLDFGGYGAVLVPAGLSFYSFQCCGYLLDVHRRAHAADGNYLRLALFVCFFPHLLAGPIARYHALAEPLWQYRRPTPDKVLDGLVLLAYGLFLKAVVGDRLGVFVDAAYSQGAAAGWQGALCGFLGFAMQLLADFGGYSLMAVGAGHLFGVELAQNFRQPFLAANLGDFWQRWHISLTRWIGDYLYRPLGRLMVRTTMLSRWWKEAITAVVTWETIGIWHGAEGTFAVFGLLQAGLIIVQKSYSASRRGVRPGLAYTAAATALTFATVAVTFGLIRASSVGAWAGMAWNLATLTPGSFDAQVSRVALAGVVLMLVVEAFARFRPVTFKSVPLRAGLVFAFTVSAALLSNDVARTFIYFRF